MVIVGTRAVDGNRVLTRSCWRVPKPQDHMPHRAEGLAHRSKSSRSIGPDLTHRDACFRAGRWLSNHSPKEDVMRSAQRTSTAPRACLAQGMISVLSMPRR
jgi:hypothetical protein